MSRIFLASRNAKKIGEMQRILAEHLPDVEVVGLDDVPAYDEPVEDQPTFEGNALLKARAGAQVTGLPTIADDSGLCVDALNGMPGVLSARWSGPPKSDERNNALLLAQLSDVPDARRGAHFACAVALVHPDGRELVVHGSDGRSHRPRAAGERRFRVRRALRRRGARDGRPDGVGLTSAELDPAEKDRISHRGRALRELAPRVVGFLS